MHQSTPDLNLPNPSDFLLNFNSPRSCTSLDPSLLQIRTPTSRQRTVAHRPPTYYGPSELRVPENAKFQITYKTLIAIHASTLCNPESGVPSCEGYLRKSKHGITHTCSTCSACIITSLSPMPQELFEDLPLPCSSFLERLFEFSCPLM